MKKLALLFTLCAITLISFGQRQQFRQFKGGIHLGYAIPSDGGGGIALALEPAYRINDQIAVGLRYESALTVRDLEGGQSAKIAATGSYTLNGNYYFSDNDFRPFAGLGLGWFVPASVEVDAEGASAAAAIDPDGTFGLYPRVGFDYKHFNFVVDYNIIPQSEIESVVVVNGVEQKSKVELKNSYISVKIGVTIGGGTN